MYRIDVNHGWHHGMFKFRNLDEAIVIFVKQMVWEDYSKPEHHTPDGLMKLLNTLAKSLGLDLTITRE